MTSGKKLVRVEGFKKGVVSPSQWPRTELKYYNQMAQRIDNMLLSEGDILSKRPGTENIGDVLGIDAKIQKRLIGSYDGTDYLVITFFNNKTNTLRTNLYTIDDTTDPVSFSFVTFFNHDSTPDYTFIDNRFVWVEQTDEPQFYDLLTGNVDKLLGDRGISNTPLPSYDFGDINYEDKKVDITFGTNDTFVMTVGDTSNAFPNPPLDLRWTRGIIIGKGSSIEAPVAHAVIQTTNNLQNNDGTYQAEFQCLEIQSFDQSDFPKTGIGYSIKRPIWWLASDTDQTRDSMPNSLEFFQNRLWMAGQNSLPKTIVGSQINRVARFDIGTGRDSDAIIFTSNIDDTGNFLWFNNGKQLEMFFEKAQVVAPQTSSEGITPSTFSLRKQASFSVSSKFKPVSYRNLTFFVNGQGNQIIGFSFNGIGQAYTAKPLTDLSLELVRDPDMSAIWDAKGSSNESYLLLRQKHDDVRSDEEDFGKPQILVFKIDEHDGVVGLTETRIEYNSLQKQWDNQIQMLASYKNRLLIPTTIKDGPNTVLRKMLIWPTEHPYFMDYQKKFTTQSTFPTLDVPGFEIGELVRVVNFDTLSDSLKDLDEKEVKDDGNGNPIIEFSEDRKGDFWVGHIYNTDLRTMYITAGQGSGPIKKKIANLYIEYIDSLDFKVLGEPVALPTFTNIQNQTVGQTFTDSVKLRPGLPYRKYQAIDISQKQPWNLKINAISYNVIARSV